MSAESPSLLLVEADTGADARQRLRVRGGRIASAARPAAGAPSGEITLDLRGDRLVPGLINAHDHLQLNVFPRVRFRERYDNAVEWIADVDSRRRGDPRLAGPAALPRDARLRHGALKNLLSGATTVAHHDPHYPALSAVDFPVRVLADYGWSHSLGIDPLDEIVRTHHDTPPSRPWFIHAGEGTDAAARQELATLDGAGCLTSNTRLIHGVAFGAAELGRIAVAGAGLIWCPSSNEFLFGRTAAVAPLVRASRVALGSDSRLSGARDLLAELRAAHDTGHVPEVALESLVTRAGAKLLGLADRGALAVGMRADLVILPRGLPLWRAARADLRCVMLAGVMQYGDAEYARELLRPGEYEPVLVDGCSKVLHVAHAQFFRDVIAEPGVEPAREAGRAA